MNKVSLLAASVALALTGCGSDDSGSATAPSGITISAFDGYFKNAVMFVDTDDDGIWELSDQFIGLTQSKGQIQMKEKPEGVIAIQTLTPGGAAQAQLISLDANKYAGVYTVDMDHPSQAMAHELVFRAPSTSNVISPITDLSLSYLKKGLTEEQLVSDLGLDSIDDLYTDFVAGDDKDVDLHKTAQLLTETKGADKDINSDPQKFVKDAAENVADMTPEQKEDPSYKAPIDGNTGNDSISYQTYINDTVFDVIEDGIVALELTHGYLAPEPVILLTVSLKDLFKDGDVPGGIESSSLTLNTANDSQILADDGKTPSGIIAYISDDNLNIGLNSTDEISQVGALQLKVTLTAADNTNTKTAIFTLNIDAAEAIAPVADSNIEAGLQTQLDSWSLEKDTDLGEGYEIDYSNLFTSSEKLELTYTSNILTNGFIIDNMGTGILGIQGIPLRSSQEDKAVYTINLMATSTTGLSTTVKLTLPEITEGTPPPHTLENKTWYYIDYDYSSDEDFSNVENIVNKCVSIRFEDGIVYKNGSNHNTTCSLSEVVDDNATYDIVGDDLIITYSYKESSSETVTHTIKSSADTISAGAQTLSIKWDNLTPLVYTYFTNKTDVENRLNITSEMLPPARTFKMYLPDDEKEEYNLGQVDISLTDTVDDRDEGEMDAGVTFDAYDNNITCATLNEFYSRFYFGNDDITVKSKSNNGFDFECYDKEEDGLKYAGIDFDLPTLTEGNKYVIFGEARESHAHLIENIKFKIEWTGKGNNE